MRVGSNPNKNNSNDSSEFTHQVIIPVYIPNEEGYFKDALKILEININSLKKTVHNKTYISIVNNGSCSAVLNFLNQLLHDKKINELIHTDNIGKVNAVFKALVGNNINFVTISDSDVLFLSNWQSETLKVFEKIAKAGVVGIVPQFKMHESNCANIIFDNLFNTNLKFIPVKNKEALINFYDSIGWERNYNQNYLKYSLGFEINNFNCFVGAGHFVATYKKEIFDEIYSFIGGKKVAGIGEQYIDQKGLEKDFWRLTTYDNFAYHMGNIYEPWMDEICITQTESVIEMPLLNTYKRKKNISSFLFFIKNRLFGKLFSNNTFKKLYYRYKKLPKEMHSNY